MIFQKATNTNHLQQIELLAYEIIPDFYAEVTPRDHNVFFVEKFQSVPALQQQLDDHYEYYLMMEADKAVGYFGIQILEEEQKIFLSKLYLQQAERGKGYGTQAMDLVMQTAGVKNIKKIVLTVNRKNERTINLYRKYGFDISQHLSTTFENGHTILDYEMTKSFP
jgi:diamine N-acetyltransferase